MTLLALSLATSSRSLMSDSRCLAPVCTMRSCFSCSAFSGPGSFMSNMPVKPMMALRGVRSSWDMLARKRSFTRAAFSSSRFLSRSTCSMRLRSVTSRMALETNRPSSVSSGFRLISTGNSLPSLRRPCSSSPAPMERVRGSAKKLRRWSGWRALKRWGTSNSMGWPSSSSRLQPNSFTACELTRTMCPSRLTMTMASGAASNRSLNFWSARLRSVMSRMALITMVPSSVSMGLRLISTGNSPPSLRRPCSSSPAPMVRVRGWPKKPLRWPRWAPR